VSVVAGDPDLLLLRTKRAFPIPRGLVARDELVRALADGLSRPLTLVLAPAGNGKTSLLAQWR
jgi:ATP/maltotriose-dependent transcriptional regulator MalT